MLLRSGDVVILGGDALLCFHGIDREALQLDAGVAAAASISPWRVTSRAG